MFLEQPTEEHVFGLVLSTIIYKGALRRIKRDVPKNLIPVIHEMVQTVNGFVNIIDPAKKIQKELYKADNLILNSIYAMRKTCPQEKLAKASHLNTVVLLNPHATPYSLTTISHNMNKTAKIL